MAKHSRSDWRKASRARIRRLNPVGNSVLRGEPLEERALLSVNPLWDTQLLAPAAQDVDAPRVVGSAVQEGDVLPPGNLTYRVQFSEPMDVNNLGTNDFSLLGISQNIAYHPGPSSRFDSSGTSLILDYGNLPDDNYRLTLLSGGLGQFRDLGGNYLDGEPVWPMPPNQSGNGTAGGNFEVNFSIDTDAVPLGRFFPLSPLGSLVQESSLVRTFINSGSDTDSFTVTLDAPQTITLIAHPNPGLRPTITLQSPDLTTLATATGDSEGQDAVLQTVAIDVTGTYTITLGGSTGGYTSLQAILNGAVENETHQLSNNDGVPTAQSLDSDFVSYGTGSLATVLGEEVIAQYASSVIGFSSQHGSDSYSAWQAIGLPNTTVNSFSPSAWAPATQNITFEYLDVGFLHPVFATGLTVREVNGAGFVRGVDVIDSEGGLHGVWGGTDPSQPGAPVDFHISWPATPYLVYGVRVQVYQSNFGQVYEMIDSVQLHGVSTPDPDIYSFTLAAGDSATLALKALSGTAPTFSLLDPFGSELVPSVAGSTNVNRYISNFVAPTAGIYYAKVMPSTSVRYSLVLTKNATFDLEQNGNLTTAQTLSPATEVLGSIGDGAQITKVTENFESGRLGSAWSTYSTGPAQIRVTGEEGTSSGSYALVMDTNAMGVYSLSEATWTVDLTGLTRATLNFAHAGFGDGLHFLPDDFTGHFEGDGVAISSDGTNWHTVWRPSWGFSFAPVSVDLGSAAAEAGLALSADFKIKFQQFGHTSVWINGRAWDDIAITSPQIESDYYRMQLTAGQPVTLSTATPRVGAGLFVLDPIIDLHSAGGQLLATSDNEASDGRNALLSYVPTVSGTYFVQVRSASATTGEYVFYVDGADPSVPPFTVVSSSPAAGGRVNSSAQMTLTFNAPVRPDSLAPLDLSVNGVAASAVTLSSDLKTATFSLSGSVVEGSNDFFVDTGAITSVQNVPLQPYSGQFTYDITAPRVISSSIQEGDILSPGAVTYTVHFDEPMAVANLDAGDVTLTGVFRGASYAPNSFSYDITGTVLTVNYLNLPDDKYTLTLVSGSGDFQDVAKNRLDGEPVWPLPPNQSGNGTAGGNFVVNFSLDNPGLAFPTPLVASAPLGSLVYTGSATTVVGAAGDTDSLALSLESGQTVTIVTVPSTTGLRPTVSLQGPDSATLGLTAAASAGQAALLQTIPVDVAGTYTINVSGDSNTTGAGTVQVILNAAAEHEVYNGPTNNSTAAAQDLTSSFIGLGGNASRAAVLGSTSDFGGDHYAFSLDAGEYVTLAVKALSGTTPALTLLRSDGTQVAVGMSGSTNVGQAITNFLVPTAGVYYARLIGGNAAYNLLVTKSAGFEINPNSSFPMAQALGPVTHLLGAISSVPSVVASESFESGALGSAWSTYSSEAATGRIQVTGAHGTNSGAYALLMDHNVASTQFNLNEAIWTVDLSGLTTASLSFARASYFDSNNFLPSSFTGHRNGDGVAISSDGTNWRTVWSATSSTSGVFSTVTVDLGAAAAAAGMPLGANFQIKFQQYDSRALTVRGRGWDDIVISTLVPGQNFDQVELTAGQPITLSTITPSGGAGEFVNNLDPAIDLLNSSGTLVASDDNGAGDGRNALLSYTPEISGIYTVRVRSMSNALGEYVLTINPLILGDMDGDGDRDNFDIDDFELALTNPSDYLALHPTLTDYRDRGDIDGDGDFDNFDIQPFETLLTSGAPAAASTPAASATSQPASGAMTAEAITLDPDFAMPVAMRSPALRDGAIALALRLAKEDTPMGEQPIAREVVFASDVVATPAVGRNFTSAADEFVADGLNVTRPAHWLAGGAAALDPAFAALEDDFLDGLLLAELSL